MERGRLGGFCRTETPLFNLLHSPIPFFDDGNEEYNHADDFPGPGRGFSCSINKVGYMQQKERDDKVYIEA